MALSPVKTSYLPERNRQASHIKRGYEICQEIEDEDGKSTKEWTKVERKQHDRENGIVLFTFEDGRQLRIRAAEKILSRRGIQPQKRRENK